MKRASTTRELLVLVMTWGLTACGGLAAADIGASESSSPSPSGSYEAVCTNRGAECDWEITKCKAEPACARWYACVSACQPNEPEACLEGCKGKTHEPDNAAAIMKCLDDACSPGSKEASGGANGGGGGDYNGGAAGYGPPEGGDASADGVNDAGALSAGPKWASCAACLYSGESVDANGTITKDCQAQCIDRCLAEQAVCQSECANSTSGCECETSLYACKTGCGTAGTYKHVIGNNAPGEVTGAPNGCLLPYSDDDSSATPWQQWEECMFDSKTLPNNSAANWNGYVSSGLHQCVMTQCASVCLPEDTYQPCSSCLQSKCAEQARAYWTSTDAQDYGWCIDYCDLETQESCDCEALYNETGEGAEILNQFVMCREQNCHDSCSSN